MPHLHIEKFKDIEYPQVKDEVTFNFVAINSNHDDEKLISVTVEDEDFFLLVKDEKDRRDKEAKEQKDRQDDYKPAPE